MSDVNVQISIERPVEQVWSLPGGFEWLTRSLPAAPSATVVACAT